MATLTGRFNRLGTSSAANEPPVVKPSQFRRIVPRPNQAAGFTGSPESRAATYEQLYAYYSNTAFDELAEWTRYRRKYGLYKYTRGIFNPVTRLVDFYVDHIYPGSIAHDGEDRHDEGIQSAIPLAFDTSEEIREALKVLWRWSNWQIKQSLMVYHGSMLGNALVEVVDDVVGGRVSLKTVYPGYVKEFQLDDDGVLLAYTLEYPILDNVLGTVKTFRKEVTLSSIRTFIDGQPQRNGANPYGFVPAVWVKHLDFGADYGMPAIRGSITKIDELNSLVSHVLDHAHKLIRSPRILWTNSQVKSLFREDDNIDPADIDERSEVTMLKGMQGGTTETLVGNLDPATIVPVVAEMIREIEKDFPELTFYDKLREQNIVTSPGAKMLMGDVEKKLRRPAANYDAASQRLFAMALAIGGYRANLSQDEGGWAVSGKLRLGQRVFAPFNLEVYSAGELEMTILPRPLIQETERERAEQLQIKGQGISSLADTLPLRERLRWLGYKERDIPAVMAEMKAEEKEKAEAEAKLAEKQAAAKARQQPSTSRSQPKSKSKAPAKKNNSK